MPEIHLKQSRFTYIVCGLFTKNKEKIQKFKKSGGTNYIYKNKLDEVCFQHDMAYGDFTDLGRRTTSDKFLRDNAFNIAKNPEYDEYKRGLTSIVYKYSDKKSKRSGITNIEVNPGEQSAKELHKPIIRKFE